MTTVSQSEDATVFRPFLRYQAPRLVPAGAVSCADLFGAVEPCAVTTGPAATHAGRHATSAPAAARTGTSNSPIPVARLAAAKDAAREAFLAAHSTHPVQSSLSSCAREAASPEAATTRKDPARRLPTPPSGLGKAGTRGGRAGAGTKRHSLQAMAAMPADAVLQSVMVNVKGAAPLLNAMFPPVAASSLTNGDEAAEGGQWVCCVSTEPATREDVVAMHAEFSRRLHARRARGTGLCPVRREVYEDVFDELLRQITLEEPARGVLLQRLRDDLRDSLRVHRDLCLGAQHLCSTRSLAADEAQTVLAMTHKVADLTHARDALKAAYHSLSVRQASLETRFEAERAARHKKQQEELAYLRRANQQLSLRLKQETERVAASISEGHSNHSNRPLEVATAAE